MAKNIFYFTNFWEIKRNYSSINEKMRNINKKILLKLRRRINDNVKRGVIKKEEYKGAHDLLAKALLLAINSWMSQQLLNGKRTEEELFKSFLWNLIYPHFTEKGKKEFKLLHHL